MPIRPSLTWLDRPSVQLGQFALAAPEIILQFEDDPLAQFAYRVTGSEEMKWDVYNESGDRLAVIRGPRVHPTAAGRGLDIRLIPDVGRVIAAIGNREIFEVSYIGAAAVAVQAEIYTSTGAFLVVGNQQGVVLYEPKVLVPMGRSVFPRGDITVSPATIDVGVAISGVGSVVAALDVTDAIGMTDESTADPGQGVLVHDDGTVEVTYLSDSEWGS
jgi:hypothetical protein